MNEVEILCPLCKRVGRRSLLGKAEPIDGYGALLLWCKKCRKEVRIPLSSIQKEKSPKSILSQSPEPTDAGM